MRSVDEGTPSPQKGFENGFCIEKEIQAIGIDDELIQSDKDEQLQIKSFEAGMHKATIED